jgi:hypothetical protein
VQLDTQGTYVFLLITDTHWTHRNLRNRVSYTDETLKAQQAIIDTINKYKNLGYKVILIFLGDIYHNSYTIVSEGIQANNFMLYLGAITEGVYSVIGNHEFTYYRDNPFWSMITKVDSVRVKPMLSDTKRPIGKFLNAFSVPDILECGDVRFTFNHYGTGILPLGNHHLDKINIALIHQDLYTKEVVQAVYDDIGEVVFEHSPVYLNTHPYLRYYKYAFLAHAHMFYSVWDYKCPATDWETQLAYLSTLGRTSVKEVSDNFLERDIPAIIVTDGKFVGREYNKFMLHPRSDSVIELQVEETKRKYIQAKERKQALLSPSVDDNPLQSLRIKNKGNSVVSHILEGTLRTGRSSLEASILTKARRFTL